MNDGLRAMAFLGGGAVLLFVALFAGLRWAPEPAPERGFGEPVDAGPLGLIYPDLFADSVVRVVYINDGVPPAGRDERETVELWRRLDSNGNMVGSYSFTTREDESVSTASHFDANGYRRIFAAGEGCTEERFELPPGIRQIGSPVAFFDAAAPGWTATDPSALPSLPSATPDSRANLRWTLEEASLEWWAAPDPLVPGASPGQQAVFGVNRENQLVMVITNRIPPASSREDPRDLLIAFVLVERFERVPGLQATRESMNFEEWCRE